MREVTRKEILEDKSLRPSARLILLMMFESEITKTLAPEIGSAELGLSPKEYIEALLQLNKRKYTDEDGVLAVVLNDKQMLMDAAGIRRYFAFKYKEKWDKQYRIFPKDLLAAYKLSMTAQENLQEKIVEYLKGSDESATVYSFSKGVLARRKLVVKSLKVNRLGRLI